MLIAVLTLLLGILAILAIIVANGFFVAQEFAFMSVDRSRLRARADEGDAAAARALRVTRRTSFMLSGAQLGITVTGLLIGYVAEPLVGESLGTLLGGAGVDPAISITIGTIIALALSTIVQMIFGELYPKNLAIASPDPLAKALARPTLIYLGAFGWLVIVFDRAAEALLRLLRIEPVEDVDSSATADDLEHLVAESRETGDLPADLSLMIDRILDFPERDVEHAMIPRHRADTVSPELPLSELRKTMVAGHTRYPVVVDDEPVGIVEMVDVLRAGDDGTVADIMRVPTIVPTLMPLPQALATMTAESNELACVIDEYGVFSGVVTVEDLAEEVVGDVTDEHDEGATEIVRPLGGGRWRMGGDVHIDEVERAVGVELPAGDYETVAGLLIAQAGGLPDLGASLDVRIDADPADLIADEPVVRVLRARVLSVARHVPSVVEVEIVRDRADAPDAEGGER
ncbi:hemolysin family protein [Microbacterium xanthum]|uniref:hemolysin family protein n=1 Tax=Microbacterium xanthum TaxID=3079794 RepID=UPI002AD445DD|nr:hemolysin family protein [Microbacterium sp. KSW-48]MDZ8171793.1 hemolysin family protein [Microbacterium sp. KSW-48]